MNKIKVIIKRPGEKPHSTWISNTFANIQKTVEGMYDAERIAKGQTDERLFIVYNTYGLDLPYNCTVQSAPYAGTVIFAGIHCEEAFYDLTDIPIDFQQFKRLFPDLFEESTKEDL